MLSDQMSSELSFGFSDFSTFMNFLKFDQNVSHMQ